MQSEIATGSDRGKIINTMLVVALLVFFGARLASFWISDVPHLVVQFSDDAYYYFKIAQNVVERGLFSFEGSTTTNGFHPLWLFLSVPVFFFAQDQLAALSVIGTLSVCLLLVGYGLIWCYLLRRFSLVAYSICMALALYYAHIFTRCNIEISLALPLALGALLILDNGQQESHSKESRTKLLMLGMLLSFLQLARLDTVYLNITIVLFLLFRRIAPRGVQIETNTSGNRIGRGTACRAPTRGQGCPVSPVFNACQYRALLLKDLFGLVLVVGPPFLTGVGYLIINYTYTGHFIPVSAAAKSMGGLSINYLFLDQLTSQRGWILYSILLVLACVHLILAAARNNPYRQLCRRPYTVAADAACVFMLLYTVHHLFVTSWFLWDWYMYPALPVAVFVLPNLVEAAFRGIESISAVAFRWLTRCVAGAAFVAIAVGVIWQVIWLYRNVDHSFVYQNYLMASVLNQELADHPRLAMGDRAGSLAYFYRGEILQIEGIVGDYEMLNAIKANRLADYITRQDVRYIVSWEGPEQDYFQWTLVNPVPWLSLGPYSELRLCRKTEMLRDKNKAGTIFVWEWPSCP